MGVCKFVAYVTNTGKKTVTNWSWYMGVCKFVAHGAWHRAANQGSHSPAGISLLASTRPKRHFFKKIQPPQKFNLTGNTISQYIQPPKKYNLQINTTSQWIQPPNKYNLIKKSRKNTTSQEIQPSIYNCSYQSICSFSTRGFFSHQNQNLL